MENVGVLDRDYRRIFNAESDLRKKEARKVKLTEVSKKVIDKVFSITLNVKKFDQINKIDEKIKEKEDRLQQEHGFLEHIQIENDIALLKKRRFTKKESARKSYRRALRITEFMKNDMKKNTLFRWLGLEKYIDETAEATKRKYNNTENNIANNMENSMDVNGIDRNMVENVVNEAFENINEIDRSMIENAVNEAFENLNNNRNESNDNETSKSTAKNYENSKENENVTVTNKETDNVEIGRPREKFAYETDKEYNDFLKSFYSTESSENVNENTVSEGIYSLRKDEIIKDDLSVPHKFKLPSVVPEVNQFFDSIPNEVVNESTNLLDKKVDDDIVSKVNDSLNDNNVTSAYLVELRNQLEAERNRKTRLTEELEAKRQRAAEAEKEVAAALREQEEKMRLVQNELEAYKEENKRLENQTQQVEETTQRQNSMRQQTLDTINALNEMMGSRAVNIITEKESGKGGK